MVPTASQSAMAKTTKAVGKTAFTTSQLAAKDARRLSRLANIGSRLKSLKIATEHAWPITAGFRTVSPVRSNIRKRIT
jgi:uncharacterized 2Fe-2S/4Fe-4S cluster protein (DUF4445 family)